MLLGKILKILYKSMRVSRRRASVVCSYRLATVRHCLKSHLNKKSDVNQPSDVALYKMQVNDVVDDVFVSCVRQDCSSHFQSMYCIEHLTQR